MTNLAMAKIIKLDISDQRMDDVPVFGNPIQQLIMVRASGNLKAVLDQVSRDVSALQRVNVSACSLGTLNLDSLCSVIKTIYSFEAANMSGVDAGSMTAILHILSEKCRDIDLGGIFLKDRDHGFFSIFSKFKSLETLSLAFWSGLTSDELIHLPKSIKELNLAGATVDSFSFLKGLNALVHLDLDSPILLSSGAQDSLVEALSGCHGLRIRVNMTRLPLERALSVDCMDRLSAGHGIEFY